MIFPAPGGSVLLGVDSILSAGYVNGLGLVWTTRMRVRTFRKLHGLNAALDTAGYATDYIGPGQIAVVPQEVDLFSRTIAENIAYGCPDATREDVERVARLALAHEFIERADHGTRP